MRTQRRDTSRQKIISANLAEFGKHAAALNWISPRGAVAAETERSNRLNAIGERLCFTFKGTKPHLGPLSPGCRLCGEGDWSCLFINGKCNCRCFYCPSPQVEIGAPTTHRLVFSKAADYTAYVNHLGFRGVSISGGEPLLTPDRALRFLQTLNQSEGRPLHLWMYTNGTLLTRDWVDRLKDAGLDEIRFDLSAVGYDLEKLSLAAGRIPIVSVEIPAIAEDYQRLSDLLPRLKACGVDHLNLHQLRLSPHNRERLAQRKYTYLHGEKVTVLESELTALALMQSVVEQGLDLAVNYCASVFQVRFQRAAVRRKSAQLMIKPYESITESGYIRSLCLVGDPEKLARQADRLTEKGVERLLWSIGNRNDRLYFHPILWDQIVPEGLGVAVGYAEASLCPHISYHRTFKEVLLNQDKKIFIERQPASNEILLDDSQQVRLNTLVNHPDRQPVPPGTGPDDRLAQYEWIDCGLQDYF